MKYVWNHDTRPATSGPYWGQQMEPIISTPVLTLLLSVCVLQQGVNEREIKLLLTVAYWQGKGRRRLLPLLKFGLSENCQKIFFCKIWG